VADLSRAGREPGDASQGAKFDGHHDGGLTRRANLRRARSKPFIYLSLTIAIAAAVGTVKRAVGDVVRSDACRRAAKEIARPADLLSPLACLGPSAGRTWGLFEDQQFRGANRGFPPWLLICRRRSAMQSMPFGGWDIRGGPFQRDTNTSRRPRLADYPTATAPQKPSSLRTW
jgi:hypothetical protein